MSLLGCRRERLEGSLGGVETVKSSCRREGLEDPLWGSGDCEIELQEGKLKGLLGEWRTGLVAGCWCYRGTRDGLLHC